MYIPDKLKAENRFVDVAIPNNRTLFSRLGEVGVNKELYSGDDTVPMFESKSDSIENYQKYAEQMAKEAIAKEAIANEPKKD